jgi:hypothetical protein
MAGLRLDGIALERLIDRYEALRNRDGMGSMLHRVSPGQRIDALQICVAAYAAGRVPDGDQHDFWLAHLRPVLAETREAAALLREAFEDVIAEKPPGKTPIRRAGEASAAALKQLVRWPRATTLATIGSLLLAGVVVFLSLDRYAPLQQANPVVAREVRGAAPDASYPSLAPDAALQTRYERFLKLVLTAAERYDNEITPTTLAAALAGYAPELGAPSFLLGEMMRTFPIDPHASISHSTLGAMALRHYAAVAAALSSGESLSAFNDFIIDDSQLSPDRPIDHATRLREFQSPRSGSSPRETLARETWPWWLRYLPLLVLPPGLAWAFWGSSNRRRELNSAALREAGIAHAEFRRAEAGTWGTSRLLQSSAGLPPLPAASQTARRLLRLREPVPDCRLDVSQSVRASLASAGDVVTVMRDGSRAVDLVFLVRRRHRHDHQRARVLRLLDALSRNGVSLTSYDYAPDPRTLTATSRTDAFNPRGPQRTLDLRGLRELHGDSLLVIVSDGDDLIDPFSQKPHSFVRGELQSWRRRILLTPVPVAEWGEREFTLAAALDAPIGRATLAGLGDLALGLVPDSIQGSPRRALDRALHRPSLFDRIELWSMLAASMLSPDDTAPRPRMIERTGLALLQELRPPEAAEKALIAELKSWLGPGFYWLAACGVYPELRVDLTLWLGARLHRYGHPANPKIFSEELFERLCLLPWFNLCHMPEWLRNAAFSALSAREKTMLRAVIDELAAGDRNPAGGARLGLQVWQSDWRGQALSADNVMIAFKSDEPSAKQAAEAETARDAWRRWLARGSARAAVVAAWAGFAVWLMPAFQSAPLPDGAWWPLLGFVGATVAWLVLAFILERLRASRGTDDQVSEPADTGPVAAAVYK